MSEKKKVGDDMGNLSEDKSSTTRGDQPTGGSSVCGAKCPAKGCTGHCVNPNPTPHKKGYHYCDVGTHQW